MPRQGSETRECFLFRQKEENWKVELEGLQHDIVSFIRSEVLKWLGNQEHQHLGTG